MNDDSVKTAVRSFLGAMGFGMDAVISVTIQPGIVEIVHLERPDPADRAFKVSSTSVFTWTPGPACYPPKAAAT
jgi:hypothetical protein